MYRVGRIHTPHGIIDTPGFVAVATQAALKCLPTEVADEAGQQLMFCNTYHLLLQPGQSHRFFFSPVLCLKLAATAASSGSPITITNNTTLNSHFCMHV